MMNYSVKFNVPEGWRFSQENVVDENGVESVHCTAFQPCNEDEDAPALDFYVGDMPEDEDAFDQAYANYVDLVGFDDDDDEAANPVMEWKFNGRKAYGFEAWYDENTPMKVICSEQKKGCLLVLCVTASSEAQLADFVSVAERGIRISVL